MNSNDAICWHFNDDDEEGILRWSMHALLRDIFFLLLLGESAGER
jgi:hypothetical protein